ncbi:MAG TPA: flagellar biosynthetic protein FliR [Burkholderiaceae bacterium]|nr:flagellar biosynthetic protein FliR [Burkholderiaceae bacterium]
MIGFTEAQVMAWVTPIFWPFLRVLALFTSAPVLSARSIPARARIGLAFFIALCAQAGLPEQPVISLNDSRALAVGVQQIVIGLSIGLTARIVFTAVEMAGELVGLQMGLNFAAFFDPTTGTQASTVGRFFGNTTMLLFVVLNGHLLLIQTVVASLHTFPIGQDPFYVASHMRLHELGALIFTYGLHIALPMIGILMFVNAVLGIMSRVAPQMHPFAIGFPLTLSAGLIGLAITIPMLEQPLIKLLNLIPDIFAGR